MNIPPESELKACLELIRAAILTARGWGWSNAVSAEQLADLMDAIHNIPEIVQNWHANSLKEIAIEIKSYDAKWAHSGSRLLRHSFDQHAELLD